MKTILVLFFLMIISYVHAQDLLTESEAVEIALKNNYDILVARNDASISKTNNTFGSAGMLPTLSINGTGSYDLKNVNQKYSAGTETNYSPLSTLYLNAGAEISWTLFDGGKMFVTKNKLNEIEKLGDIQFKNQVLQTQFDVISAYYNLVRQKQQLNSVVEIIHYNSELVRILQVSFSGGSIAKSSLLQAKIDLNVYREDSINQQYNIEEQRKTLNRLLNINADSTYLVYDSIPLAIGFDKNDLIQKLDSFNTSILASQKQVEIAKLSMKEYSRSRFPLINLWAGYYFSRTNNSTGSLLNSHSNGPQFGASISIPIYQAGKNQRQMSIAKIEVESAEYSLENLRLSIKTNLLNLYDEYENQLRLLDIEKENNGLTKENLTISAERLKLGQTTSLEVHQAQENYVQSCTRLINFEYNLKVAETKLKQLVSLM
jgi:outer membrane protein